MKSKQKEESDINVGLMAEMDTIYNDKEVLRSDSKLSKILHKISTRSVNSLQDLIWQCDLIRYFIKYEEQRGGITTPVVGTRTCINAIITEWLIVLSGNLFRHDINSGTGDEYADVKHETEIILIDQNLKDAIMDCIEKMSALGIVKFCNENVIGMIMLITPIDIDIALKITSSLLVAARQGNFCVNVVPSVMPILCQLLCTLTNLMDNPNNYESHDLHVEGILANVAELIWTLITQGKTAAVSMNTMLRYLNNAELNERSEGQEALESTMASLNGLIKSLGAALWGNPPYADGVYSLRIFWLDTLSLIRKVFEKLIVFYSKTLNSELKETASSVILEAIAAVKRLVDGHLHALTPDEWEMLEDIIEFGLAPLIIGVAYTRPRSSSSSSRISRDRDLNSDTERSSHASSEVQQATQLRAESIKLLHQFQFQESSPPVHFNLTLLRLLLVGEGILDLHAARGVLDEPVQYIGQFLECVFTGRTDAEGRLEALKLVTEPNFFSSKNQGSSYASVSMASFKSATSQSAHLTQQLQQYYVNLPPPSIWEICVIHKAPGFINFFLQVLTDCVSFKGHNNVVDDELHLHAVKTLGKVYRSIYTVAADREYVIDTLIGIACASNIPRGSSEKDSSTYGIRSEAIYQIECALVVAFGTLVHTHAKVPRLVSALLQITRHCMSDTQLVTKALIPICRLRSDEYGRACILPRSIIVEDSSDNDDLKDGSSYIGDSEYGDYSYSDSVENDVVLVQPFLFFKSGDTKLGVFRDDNSSKRSHSKKGTILPLDRVILCLEDTISYRRKVLAPAEESFLLCMIYNTLEHWSLSGIDIDVDRAILPLSESLEVLVERCRFLSSCVHYFDDDDEIVKLIPDATEPLMSCLKSDCADILLYACRGLMLVISDEGTFVGDKPNFIMIGVLERLDVELTATLSDRVDKCMLFLSVVMEFLSIYGVRHLSNATLKKACKIFYEISSRPNSRQSQLLALQCTSLITLSIEAKLANEIYDDIFDGSQENTLKVKVDHFQGDDSNAVFSDLFWRSQWIPNIGSLTFTGSKTLSLHKAISRKSDDIKMFLYDKAGAWICGNSVLTCRIGKAMTSYQGWVEFTIRSATRCDQRLLQLSGYPTTDYTAFTKTPWGARPDWKPVSSIPGCNIHDDQREDTISLLEKETDVCSKAIDAIKSFEIVQQEFKQHIGQHNNETPLSVSTWGYASISATETPALMNVFVSLDEVESLDIERQRYSRKKCNSESDSLFKNENIDNKSTKDNFCSAVLDKKVSLTIHKWLNNVYGANKIDLRCVSEIELCLNSSGFGNPIIGLPETESTSQPGHRTLYFGKEKTSELMYDKIQRGLSILDRTVPIEPHKVALFFSCPFGEHNGITNKVPEEDWLLSISHASPQFWEFTQGLGTPVRSQDLTYFSGGLDTSSRCEDGDFSLIWMIDEKEGLNLNDIGTTDLMVLFHTIPLMPLREKDTSIRNRKRHVGNDYVHIIYTERDASLLRRATCSMKDGHVYTNSIIGGEFGLVTIFVDNLPATPAFSRITVQTKHSISEKLSVLRGSYVMPSEYAPRAVRRIAVRANILCRSLMEDKIGLASNWEERLHLIKKMKKHVKLA